jgi:hypothetical protein
MRGSIKFSLTEIEGSALHRNLWESAVLRGSIEGKKAILVSTLTKFVKNISTVQECQRKVVKNISIVQECQRRWKPLSQMIQFFMMSLAKGIEHQAVPAPRVSILFILDLLSRKT